jgi:hypothetical protein
MYPVKFKPTISAGERPQTSALDRAAAGTGVVKYYTFKIFSFEYNISIKLKNYSLSDACLCFYVKSHS